MRPTTLPPTRPAADLHSQRLLETLPAGAYVCDLDGLITYFNPAAVRLWGREPKLNDPVDRWCGSFKLFQPDGTPIRHDQCWMARAIQTGDDFIGCDILVERPDGTRANVLAHASPVRDDAGRMIAAVNVLVDVSDRKRAEAERDAGATDNARLCARLLEADRKKDEFLAVLAHELRNPLAPIHNAVQILRARGPDDPILDGARAVIERQARQLARLVDDLLDLSRITTGRLELRRAQIDLREVLRSAVETSQPAIDSAGLELRIELPNEPVWLDGDLTRLAQVMSNLLNNAARYTDRGGTVTLAAERQGSDAVVAVRDTGVGIPTDMLSRVFEMFTQVDRSGERGKGGLGIGLTLVKRLTEMHGGTVEARSAGPGQGSEFIVRLPVALDGAPPPGAGTGVRSGPSLRVVVVDDNPDMVASLATLLRLLGHVVREAFDGQEAVEAALAFRPDVVLMDIGLPKLSGYEAAERLRADPVTRGATLIATTGWSQEEDRERSRQAGFDHHLIKPVDPAELIGLLAAEARSRAGRTDGAAAMR
jgi:signal transduction histidine kinase/ActR/RegA family two-component response regulator